MLENPSQYNYFTNFITSDSLIEDTAWSSEVEWSASWVHVTTFTQVIQVLDFVSGKEWEKKFKKIKKCKKIE